MITLSDVIYSFLAAFIVVFGICSVETLFQYMDEKSAEKKAKKRAKNSYSHIKQ